MNRTFTKLSRSQQAAILDAAAAVFAARGYAATVDEICLKAGISNGALYKYFRNKEALFEAVIGHGIAIIRSMYGPYEESTRPVEETLRLIFKDLGPLVKSYNSYVSIYLDLGTTAMNRFAKKFSQELENVGRDFLSALLERSLKDGSLKGPVDVPAAVYCIDTLIVLYAYSFVSEHYRQRLDGFIGLKRARVTAGERLEFAMRTVLAALGAGRTHRHHNNSFKEE
jgi:TetR/AcrR family transcriptional regulator